MASLSTKQQISKANIALKTPKTKREGPRYSKIQIDGSRLLLKTEGKSWGLRYDQDKNGNAKYTLPMIVDEEFQSNLYKVAEKLGDEEYAPIYETDDGPLVYVRVNTQGFLKSLVQDTKKKNLDPSELTSTYLGVTAVIEVDSLRESDEYDPKMQLTLYQAMLEELEPEDVEDLL